MRITFIVPTLNLTGGLRVVSIYARLLSERGHQVTVVSPNKKQPKLKDKVKELLKWKGYTFSSGFDDAYFRDTNYQLKILDKYRAVTSSDVPDADIVIATYWNTAEWINSFPNSKGKKIYFIQGYEIHPWLPVERVKGTYLLPYKKIVVAEWLADIMKHQFQQTNISIVMNAVDHKLFYASKRGKNSPTVFGMIYSSRTCKGSQMAFSAFSKLQKKYPMIKLIAFGTEPINQVENLPEGNTVYFQRPSQQKIRNIYSQCDAWLFTSSSEGFGLPILEAMACRTPVIGTRCGAAPDLLMSGGGILINIDEHAELVAAMTKICNMSNDDWLFMSDMAYKEAKTHTWQDKTVQFERVLSELA